MAYAIYGRACCREERAEDDVVACNGGRELPSIQIDCAISRAEEQHRVFQSASVNGQQQKSICPID